MVEKVVFFDAEIGVSDKKVMDIGAVSDYKGVLHTANISEFNTFIEDAKFLCGHNVVHHDIKYLSNGTNFNGKMIIDTLYLSPLLFPCRPYHKLLKDDKLQVDELNNPVNDSQKAKMLFADEFNAFCKLSINRKKIYCGLLYEFKEFKGFFEYVKFRPYTYNMARLIFEEYEGKICANVDLKSLIENYPMELAYALALIGSGDYYSVTPYWLTYNFPKINNVMKLLCNTPCEEKCSYCSTQLDIHKSLKEIFGYNEFRKYNGEPLQEKAAQAAVEGKSVLAVFPTGGGKSITFQLPALMAGRVAHGLTVVISPLQSLMKDQVDNLAEKGIEDAVTINGMLNPIERKEALERVSNGRASLLYIAPEMLRSKTIERILRSRNIVRFVIDEAHCFSAWGQDFRVDYLYIGDFIRKIQKDKNNEDNPIPVSCFTATAKQKVIIDICLYFKEKLGLDLEIYATSATRENLHYTVLYQETNEEKYNTLRSLIDSKNCPTIVYVSRTKRTYEIAEKLKSDGFAALPYNGKMEPNEKIANQEAFMANKASIIVATSAFGMGVDKSDVGLVIHYDISDSLENYVQEAGRAGRNPSLQADCYVLFNDNDLDKHFILLNQTKLSISEIQQVWSAIKDLTKQKPTVCCSALEIARTAGWDDSAGPEIETRVRTAIAALEGAGYISRGRNVPRVYATSIKAKSMAEASERIRSSSLYTEKQKETAIRVIKALISSRSIAAAGNADAESRVDYLADMLGEDKKAIIEVINLMRQDGLLDDYSDMSAYIYDSDNEHKSKLILDRFVKLERFLLSKLTFDGICLSLKELNEMAQNEGITNANVKNIRILLYYLTIKNYIVKEEDKGNCTIKLYPLLDDDRLSSKFEKRIEICEFVLKELYNKANNVTSDDRGKKPVDFSLVGLFNDYQNEPKLALDSYVAQLSDMEDALLYLSKIGALKLEGGFLVSYNALEIKRLEMDNRIKYKIEDYKSLDEFYKQRIRQIHIVGEYAKLMVKDYDAALQFVQDYFNMDFKKFIDKYFKGERALEIERNITPEQYKRIFGGLSDKQRKIIDDSKSKYIVVAAGPGSGKTKVLVHKLASLLSVEDVKHEQLLMVTFSRAAATEFKKRLIELIGNAANFVEIKTFHSYCFDLLGKIGTLEGSVNVVKDAAETIKNGEVEQGKIVKSVLVVDEAQDMDKHEFDLVKALMEINEDMRVIAVGDDDQNIYEFRGSDSKYLKSLIEDHGATKYEMTANYRSVKPIVSLANAFVGKIKNRLKIEPIESALNESGEVNITRYASSNMESAIVSSLINQGYKGKTCVLTNTNEEALKIVGLLLKQGKRAKLIQSIDGFRLYNLVEIRKFLNLIDAELRTPVIPDFIWNNAKRKLFSLYKDSTCLENIARLISDFERVHSVKYRSDIDEFIRESNYEDFYEENDLDTIYVSTIHKSKGREFDNVYIMLKDSYGRTSEELRKLYVGITRAKKRLNIHTNTNMFDDYSYLVSNFTVDDCDYNEPNEIMLQTTHRDVVLNFFKDKKDAILSMRSGQTVEVEEMYLFAQINGVRTRIAKFSRSFMDKWAELTDKGYALSSDTSVAFIVNWKGEQDEEETPVLLLNVKFKCNSES